MPREFRKRGRGNKRQKTHLDPLPVQAPSIQSPSNFLNKDVLAIALEAQDHIQADAQNQTTNRSKAYPELSPDLRAYWRAIDEQIQDLERLAHPQNHIQDEQEDQDQDDRHLILRSALDELLGHELALATDPETSIILERLIYSMDHFAIRVLADKLLPHFVDLCSHPQASHVIQTLLALSAPVLDHESRDHPNINSTPDPEDLPLMSLLLSQASKDLLPHLDRLSQHPSGSHVLVVLFLLVLAKPIAEETYRSRNSSKWRSKQGPLRSVFRHDHSGSMPDGAGANRQVPGVLSAMADQLYRQIKSNWSMLNGAGVRNAASNPSTVVLLRLIVDVEFDRGEAECQGSLTDILLGGLIATQPSPSRSDFVEVCLRDVTGSRVIEGIIGRLSGGPFGRFYSIYLAGRMGQLSSHPVTNFVVARAISRLEHDQFLGALEEYQPKMIDCIDNYRTGALKGFVDRSVCFSGLEQESVAEKILKAFGIEEEADYRFVVPCLVSLMRLEYFRKTTAFKLISSSTEGGTSGRVKLPESNIQGSLLLQAILQQKIPNLSGKIVRGLTSLPLELIIQLSRDPIGSRPLDVLLTSPTIPPSARRQFIVNLIGTFHTLVDDRIGSRIAERSFEVSDVYLKEKITASLVERQVELQRSAFGGYLWKKILVPLFERNREEWKSKMISSSSSSSRGLATFSKSNGDQQQQQQKVGRVGYVEVEMANQNSQVTNGGGDKSAIEKINQEIEGVVVSGIKVGKQIEVNKKQKEEEDEPNKKKEEKKNSDRKRKIRSEEIGGLTIGISTSSNSESNSGSYSRHINQIGVIDELFKSVGGGCDKNKKKKIKKKKHEK